MAAVGSTYKIRKLRKDKDNPESFDAASVAVPMEIAQVLPEGIRFSAELTDDGILYRPVHGTETKAAAELPEWLKPNTGSKATTTKKS